jgi:hypothetical protein
VIIWNGGIGSLSGIPKTNLIKTLIVFINDQSKNNEIYSYKKRALLNTILLVRQNILRAKLRYFPNLQIEPTRKMWMFDKNIHNDDFSNEKVPELRERLWSFYPRLSGVANYF